MKITSSKDLVLWLLYVPGFKNQVGEPIKGRTRLIKTLFLFKEEVWKQFNKTASLSEDVLPNFEAHNFGPYSQQIFEDLEFLIEYEFVKKEYENAKIENDNDFWRDVATDEEKLAQSENIAYKITDLGKKFIESGELGSLSSTQKNLLSEFKSRCQRVSLNDLIQYVYQKYPKYTVNSKIKDKYL